MRIKKIRQSLGAIGKVADSYTTDNNACYNAPYVNSIIESGSNENGKYVKFPDGTLIQYLGTSTIPANSVSKTITFPIAFIDTSYSVTINNYYTNSADVIFALSAKHTTDIAVYPRVSGAKPTNPVEFNYIAIGKWK